MPGMPGAQSGQVPIMRMYGVTQEGHSVCAHVHGFHPYFFVLAPPGFTKNNLGDFRLSLNRAVQEDSKSKDTPKDCVLNVELMMKSTIYGFQGNKMSQFLKITMAVPRMIAAAKRLLDRNEVKFQSFNLSSPLSAFEANIDFEIRFMADTKVVGCNWIEFPAGKYKIRDGKSLFGKFMSRCQMEVDIAWDDFISHAPDGDWSDVAPFRIMSFDIECAGRKAFSPSRKKIPSSRLLHEVIACQGDPEPFIRNVFTLNTCGEIVGSVVISCKTETELLDRWADFVRQVDPDILTGYNINNFDFPYLLNRAKHLNVRNFNLLGRVIDVKSVVKDSILQSKQMGRRENKVINIDGRVQLDLLLILVRDYKLRSYTLNAVSYHFLQPGAIDKYNITPEQYVKTPSGNFFVKSSVRKGLLPEILESLLGARKKAKADLKRRLILSVKRYTMANGYKFDADVIYGDTDSVMVKFGVDNVKDAMALGEESGSLRFAEVHQSHQKILIDRDPEGAMEYAKQNISDLLCNRVGHLSTGDHQRSSPRRTRTTLPSISRELANKMKKRDAGSAPKLGDRVPLRDCCRAKGTPAYQKAEDPIYVLENNIPIDAQHISRTCWPKPLLRIFEPILGEH
ncbi:hypothetical protein TCAL_17384 [Tigriopus californicus]|uniref:DNA polymerase n=1 Tax=Tigriopus californicus TaxID=6832 RepID=A0A553NV85_TIGCA|nr:hypothetical protein TCAL_17384 [Tigriopus californicus]